MERESVHRAENAVINDSDFGFEREDVRARARARVFDILSVFLRRDVFSILAQTISRRFFCFFTAAALEKRACRFLQTAKRKNVPLWVVWNPRVRKIGKDSWLLRGATPKLFREEDSKLTELSRFYGLW